MSGAWLGRGCRGPAGLPDETQMVSWTSGVVVVNPLVRLQMESDWALNYLVALPILCSVMDRLEVSLGRTLVSPRSGQTGGTAQRRVDLVPVRVPKMIEIRRQGLICSLFILWFFALPMSAQ